MIMQLFEKRRRIGERLQGTMLPVLVSQLKAMTRGLDHLKVVKGAKDIAEVVQTTVDQEVVRHVVDLQKRECTCREWQISGMPCPHARALITASRNVKVEDYMDPCYSVAKFRYAYAGIVQPMPDMSQWPTVDLEFEVLAPLTRRAVGRQRKNRIPECMEGKRRTKGKWQVLCKTCGEKGHRSSSAKCPYNGTKKRYTSAMLQKCLIVIISYNCNAHVNCKKSRAKKQQPGQKKGTSEAGTSSQGDRTPKWQKLTEAQELTIIQSPRPVFRSQMSLTIAAQGTSPNSPGPVTRRQLALSGDGPSPEARSPPKATARKKLTPRKGK